VNEQGKQNLSYTKYLLILLNAANKFSPPCAFIVLRLCPGLSCKILLKRYILCEPSLISPLHQLGMNLAASNRNCDYSGLNDSQFIFSQKSRGVWGCVSEHHCYSVGLFLVAAKGCHCTNPHTQYQSKKKEKSEKA
jgi:hypothetical protein